MGAEPSSMARRVYPSAGRSGNEPRMGAPFEIAPLEASLETIAALSELIVEVVAAGGSVSFMHPLPPPEAAAFWEKSLAAASAGGRVVLGAWANGVLAGTVTLELAWAPNQPHRGEIAKLMTRPAYRGRGIARSLMVEAERIAATSGRTLLTLDTAEEDGAAGLYEGVGFQRVGVIPDFALKPYGGLTGTIIYYKRIGAAGWRSPLEERRTD
jgi:ribosomal protein S18 acetylase RimI-like enzyme